MDSRCVNSSLNTSRLWFIIDYTSSSLALTLSSFFFLLARSFFYLSSLHVDVLLLLVSIDWFSFNPQPPYHWQRTFRYLSHSSLKFLFYPRRKQFENELRERKNFHWEIALHKKRRKKENFSGESKLYD